MDIDAALEIVRDLVIAQSSKPLSDVQSAILRGALLGKTFSEIAEECPCNESYAKEVSSQLCKLLSAALGVPIRKRNLRSALERRLKQRDETQELLMAQEKKAKSIAGKDASNNSSSSEQVSASEAQIDPVSVDCDFVGEGPIAHPSIPNQNFVGRDRAIASLNTHINQGAKIIVIQANGGVGKTTLAHEYLNSQGFELVLDLPMAKEKDNIQLVDSVIEGWLKQDFDEEPGREFWEMLRRLKRQLQTRKIGVLIDNLEPALDGQGRFIEPHRRYVELLRVLADPTVQSVTLITSRVRLCEPDVNVAHYLLPKLDEQAWQQFFISRHINIDIPILNAMHKAYGGNAKVMGILCGAILEDFDGDMVGYWRENRGDLLVKTDLKNLVTTQFERLQELGSEAYQLLCRLGCYRYQDVPTIPTEGLLCLLWDVPEGQRRRVIESLRNRSLVEFNNGEYWLHPMIREEAIARLRANEDWEEVNRKAADFWTSLIENFNIKNHQECLKKLEAFYHYKELKDWENAAKVLTSDSSNVGLLSRLRCFGYIETSIKFIHLLLNTNSLSNSNRGELYSYLGDLYSLFGQLKEAITAYHHAIDLKKYCVTTFYVDILGALAYLYMVLGEYEQSINLFESLISCAEDLKEEGNEFLAYINACLSFSYYQNENHEQSLIYLKNAIKFQLYLENSYRTWITGYGLYNLGKAMVANNYLNEAEEIYKKLKFSQDRSFYFFQGLAANGLAELYREQSDFATALSHHSESIALLDKIGAKCDLAEAHYQLALTHQKMGDAEKSQTPFQEAIRLFNEMEAPNQVEKVRKAIGKSDEV